MTERTILRCFDPKPHDPHDWTLYYSEPPTPAHCPGASLDPGAVNGIPSYVQAPLHIRNRDRDRHQAGGRGGSGPA